MATERNKFKLTTKRASIHGTTKGRIPTIDHLVDVFHNNRTRMKDIFNFFVFFGKNLLYNVHKIIMHQKVEKRKPLIPLMNEGLGELKCRRHIFYQKLKLFYTTFYEHREVMPLFQCLYHLRQKHYLSLESVAFFEYSFYQQFRWLYSVTILVYYCL